MCPVRTFKILATPADGAKVNNSTNLDWLTTPNSAIDAQSVFSELANHPPPDPKIGSPAAGDHGASESIDRLGDTIKNTNTRAAAKTQAKHNGPPPRCARPMEVREHDRIRNKQRHQPYYYSRWYRCNHKDCRTTLVMPEEFIVLNDNSAAQRLRRLKAIYEQLGIEWRGS